MSGPVAFGDVVPGALLVGGAELGGADVAGGVLAGAVPLGDDFGRSDFPPPSPSHPVRVNARVKVNATVPGSRTEAVFFGRRPPDLRMCEFPPRYVPSGL
ncbi:hypothetical protein OG948_30765 [Embleya sp. NBC_00888]|uniref:hypothetical protein n=1 Tax=Embleya sp. NBC_00888 TaxID=2975960 RepID=UPI00386BD975|nr:hypothetical protein OG948_30765 [Embleya sp. NBC_00888]